MKKENPFESRLIQLENEMEFIRTKINEIDEDLIRAFRIFQQNLDLSQWETKRLNNILWGFKIIGVIFGILSILNMVSLYLRYTGKM